MTIKTILLSVLQSTATPELLADAILGALAEQGMVIRPLSPTREMIEASMDESDAAAECWRNMAAGYRDV